ncbi:hypothetical protein [Tardiphaga sp.]|jgi:hypothetical protein|uniref:hypothetical protein n=1 Tax=Tardiphaga sp. TaxID=1926292 RepID=UPI0037D99883
MSTEADIVERLVQDHQQLSKMSEAARFAGRETGVRVRDTSALLQDLDGAVAEITKLRAERDAAAQDDMVLVPKVALLWLNGEAPDADGKWFGEHEDEAIRTPRKRTPAYWWRSKFRSMVPNWPKAPAVIATEGDSQ